MRLNTRRFSIIDTRGAKRQIMYGPIWGQPLAEDGNLAGGELCRRAEDEHFARRAVGLRENP